MEYKELKPGQVVLDHDNPRLPDGTSSDKEAINRLLSEGSEQLIALARDIAERGMFNPAELPIVVAEGGKYLVLEGNRRFAALKLLVDPKLADDLSHQAAFERIKARTSSPSTVTCTVVQNREDADHWIMLRHTGANEGVGVRRWSAEQTATHRRRMHVPIDSGTIRSLTLADELTEAYQGDESLVELINRIRTERLTNLGRFFSPGILVRLQLELRQSSDRNSQTLWARYTSQQLHPFFRWSLGFIGSKSVDEFKNEAKRNALLNQHHALLPPHSDQLSESRRLADQPFVPPFEGGAREDADAGNEDASGRTDTDEHALRAKEDDGTGDAADGTTSGASGKQSRSAQKRDDPPERFIFSEVRLPNLGPTVQQLLREAKKLPIEDNSAITCVLARVVVELAVSESKVLEWSSAKDADRLSTKIKKCILTLDPDIEKRHKRSRPDLYQAFLEASEFGVAYLHQFMHNPTVRPDPHLARRFSLAFSPLLIAINDAIE